MNKEKNQNPKPPAESDEKLRAEVWERYKDANPPKGQAQLYYADNAEYWRDGWNAARANDSRVTKIGENVTTENVSNENVSNESDGKSHPSPNEHWYPNEVVMKMVAAARANPVADPRVAELVEAMESLLTDVHLMRESFNGIRNRLTEALRKFERRET